MEFLGDKLSVAHSHVTGWVVNVRRSLQGTLSAVSAASSRGEGNFKRTNSMRSLASRSRESFRRFSLRSQQRLSLLRRTASPDTPAAVRHTLHMTHDKHTTSFQAHVIGASCVSYQGSHTTHTTKNICIDD